MIRLANSGVIFLPAIRRPTLTVRLARSRSLSFSRMARAMFIPCSRNAVSNSLRVVNRHTPRKPDPTRNRRAWVPVKTSPRADGPPSSDVPYRRTRVRIGSRNLYFQAATESSLLICSSRAPYSSQHHRTRTTTEEVHMATASDSVVLGSPAGDFQLRGTDGRIYSFDDVA